MKVFPIVNNNTAVITKENAKLKLTKTLNVSSHHLQHLYINFNHDKWNDDENDDDKIPRTLEKKQKQRDTFNY